VSLRSRPPRLDLKGVVVGIVALYYAIAVVERLLPQLWLRRFQRHFGNPGGQLMSRLPGWAVVETTGRRTGRRRQVPVGGRLIGGSFWLVAVDARDAGYVKNIEVNPKVRVQVRGRWMNGAAHVLPGDAARRRMFQLNPINGLYIALAGREHTTIRVDLERNA
jgi:deazaflavin-dependent oxidoreductase (nitroreductase family)